MLNERLSYEKNMMKKDSDKIKIFISMHEKFYSPKNKLFAPIQVGTELSMEKFDGMLHDNEGDNISEKNKMYCELTAQYWAWKNMPELEYYGFFHYRRYLSFNPIQMEHYENIVYRDWCDEKTIDELMLKEDIMTKLISSYDVIYPQENPIGGDTIYEHWCKHLEKRDIDTLVNVILELYPNFYELTREVLNSKQAIHCNMFIMKKKYFVQYSEWLFSILEECEKRLDFSDYNTEKLRTLGHMAERLCAIYAKYLEKEGAKICYVQRVQFTNNKNDKIVDLSDQKDQVPIMLSCNNGYVKIASVLIESILKNSSNNHTYKIFILNTDITNENKQILVDQVSTNNNFEVDFINVERRMSKYKNLFIDRHLSLETYFRFLALELFPNLKKILYLDCDMVVERDVYELFDVDMNDFSIVATKDVDIISLYPKEDETDPEVRENIDNILCLENYTDYFQAGMLVFNLDKIRKKYDGKMLFDVACRRKWKFQDQDVLNYLFNGDVLYTDMKWNTLYECFNRKERVENYVKSELATEYISAKKNPWIVHYAGTPKPWDDMKTDMGEHFWKYAKTSPFFEILIHELTMRNMNNLNTRVSADVVPRSELDEVIRQRDDIQWRLDETRKSFSYKLGYKLTTIPRLLRKKGE